MKIGPTLIPLAIFVAAALLEVGGDAVVRQGLRGQRWLMVLAGCSILAIYGLVVNLVKWDFARLLGVYVAVFAVVSVLTGRFLFKEDVIPRHVDKVLFLLAPDAPSAASVAVVQSGR